jgi:hypothetical protein
VKTQVPASSAWGTSASKAVPCCASCWWRRLKRRHAFHPDWRRRYVHLAMRRHNSIAKVAMGRRLGESRGRRCGGQKKTTKTTLGSERKRLSKKDLTEPPDNSEWARRKSNLVARFHRSSYAIGLELKQSGSTLLEKVCVARCGLCRAQRRVSDLCVERRRHWLADCLSVPQRSDHELVVEGLCAHLARDYAGLKLPLP